MTKKNLKEMKVTTYTSKVHISFGSSFTGTPRLSVFFLKQFYVG